MIDSPPSKVSFELSLLDEKILLKSTILSLFFIFLLDEGLNLATKIGVKRLSKFLPIFLKGNFELNYNNP